MHWFAIDSEYDLVWLSMPDLLDTNGDGINEFENLESKWSANYVLSDNLEFDQDSSKVDWNGDGAVDDSDLAGLPSIGTSLIPFKGKFNGNYHSIKNLLKTGSSNRNGLFGVINGASIENLRLENLKFYSDDNYNGGIVGRADMDLQPGDSNIIRRCMVTGLFYLTMNDDNLYTGGIIGRTDNAQISECVSFLSMYAVGDSLDNRRVGGIAGQIQGKTSIVDCYSISTVSTYEQSGLLVARSYDDNGVVIRNSYAAGTISGTSDTVQSTRVVFAGLLDAPGISSCYFDTTLSDFPEVGTTSSPVDVNGLTTTEFSDPANFKGWDFTNTWRIMDVNGTLRPRLVWEEMLDSLSDQDFPEKGFYPGPVLQWERTREPVFVPGNIKTAFRVYPNPADQYLIFEAEQYPANINIYNLLGHKILSIQIRQGENIIDIAPIPAGVYILKAGSMVSKFVKN